MADRQAYEFYADPANQVPAGPPVRRTRGRLSATVPVRFPEAMIEAIKRLADRDGVTVSSWIRRLVAREVMRRQPAAITMPSSAPIWQTVPSPEGTASPVTTGSAEPDRLELDACVA